MVFSVRSVLRATGTSESVENRQLKLEVSSWKPVSSARELQMKGVGQWGQEPLDMEVKDATMLGAATKQHDLRTLVCSSDL